MTSVFFLSLPALACFLSALLLVLCPISFFWLKRAIEQLPKVPMSDPAVEAGIMDLASQIGQLRSRLEEVEQRRAPLSDWTAAEPNSVNLNRRGQVLRLYRRGDSVTHIASALGLSTGEVALIVKVQEMNPPGRNLLQNPAGEL